MSDEKVIRKPLPPGRVYNEQGKSVFAKGHTPPKGAGRPKGSLSKTKALVEALIGTSGTKVAEKIIKKALDDNDKDQIVCLKMLLDRLVPPQRSVDIRGSQETAIQILVEGVQEFSKVIKQEAIEGDYEEVDDSTDSEG